MIIFKSTPHSKMVYGDNRELPFSMPCPDCNGGHAKKVSFAKNRANIPASFYDAQLTDFCWDVYKDADGKEVDTTKIKAYVDSFVDDFSEWEKEGLGLYIYSKTRGSGKTFLASCICNDLMRKYPMTTKFVSASELINLSRKKDERDFVGKDPIEVLCECKLLVLDDLGQKNTGNEWLTDILFRVIDARYQKKLVTVITSNMRMNELKLDERVVDRLAKLCQPLPLPEYSYRLKEASDGRTDFLRRMGVIKGGKHD